MLNNDLLNAFAAAVSTLGVALSVHIYTTSLASSKSFEGCSYMSRFSALTREDRQLFFSLRSHSSRRPATGRSHHSSAKKCFAFPKSFGKIFQRFVFLLLLIQKQSSKRRKKLTYQCEKKPTHFFHRKFQNLSSMSNKLDEIIVG